MSNKKEKKEVTKAPISQDYAADPTPSKEAQSKPNKKTEKTEETKPDDELNQVWEHKLNELQKQRDGWEDKYTELKREYKILQQNSSSTKQQQTNQHSGEFWIEIEHKLLTDPDYIKSLVRNKILTVFDRNPFGQTLLMMAAYKGCYEIVQFCINCGADMNAKSSWNETALSLCRGSGYYHIEQLLLFSAMNVNIGNEIKNKAATIHKQNGINENILNELALIGEQSKQLFETILMELMISSICKRLSFSDTMLNVCWNMVCGENKNPLSSDLWRAISSTISDIIQNGSKRDWYWFKTCVMPSTLWFTDMNSYSTMKEEKEQKEEQNINSAYYLYYELLKLVDLEAENQLNKLEKDLNNLANENKKDWNKLTIYDIVTEGDNVRQDMIPNGIVSRYTYNQLSESSGATFNSPRFYDYNQYLSQLVLLAQIVDDRFQSSVQKIFDIDKVTSMGYLKFNHTGNVYDDEKKQVHGDGEIKYMRGPVKLVERARYKAQTDYGNEEYPASACVLDLNRCSLVFNDISTLLTALDLFVNKVKYYQSGNIIGITRVKNGFIKYIKKIQYADIKLNVLIKGKHNNIIGEVQFLLEIMKSFKDKAHNLYSVQRQKEAIDSSVSKILPILLDENKQLFIAGSRGNVDKLCELMVINNKSIDDIMKIDKETGNTILHKICIFGHDKAYSFLKSILSKQEFVKHTLLTNVWNQRPVEYSIRCSQVSTAKHLFDNGEIQKFYKDKNELYRLCYHLFVKNRNDDLTGYILNILNISNDDIKEMMNFKYKEKENEIKFPNGAILYGEQTIISRTVRDNTFKALKTLISIIGEKMFIANILVDDKKQINAFEYGLERDKMKMIKYMLSFKEIKEEYSKNDGLLFRLLYWLFGHARQEKIINFILSELNISNDRIKSLIKYKYKYPIATQQVSKYAMKYHQYSIIACIINLNNLNLLKYFVDKIIGRENKKIFFDGVFYDDGWHQNAVENAVKKNKFDTIQYLLSFKEIKNKYMKNNNLLFRLIYWLFAEGKCAQTFIEFVLYQMDITNDKMKKLIMYKYPFETDISMDAKARKYNSYSIIARIVLLNNLDSLKYLAGIIGEKVFVSAVFLKDGLNKNAICYVLQSNKLEVMRYIMNINEIKNKCMNDMDELYTIILYLNTYFNESMARYIVHALNLSQITLQKVTSYKNVDIAKILNIIPQNEH